MATPPHQINQYFDQFRQKCTTIFHKTPRQWQVEVGGGILRSHYDNSDHNQLLIRKTGEGKSLVYLVTGACIGGVTLCISPLLSLAMDQSRKVLKHAHSTCTVSSFHLDEMSPSHLQSLQRSLTKLPSHCSTFIFTSPQCFRNRHHFRNFLFVHRLIRFVVVDEIHLFAQFGNTFRNEFGHLKRLLFDKFHQSDQRVPSLFMTATCTEHMIADIERITGYQFHRRHWPSPLMMSHRSVGIEARYTHHHFSLLKRTIADAIRPSPSRPSVQRKVIIYTPARSRAKSTSERLGHHLDTMSELNKIDIITLVGTMTKEEKAFYTNVFLSDKVTDKYNPHILCATSGVGNAGIDSHQIGVVYRLGMPDNITDLYQEKGRAGRYNNALPSENRYLLCFAIEDLLYLFKRAMDPEQSVLNEEYRLRMVSDLLVMVKVLASDLCFNVHIETLLGNPDMIHHLPEPCGDCTICKNTKLFPQINKEGTKTVFLDLFVFGDHSIDGMPILKNVIKAMKAYPNVRQMIMSNSRSRTGIEPVEIKKVLFMLVGHGILKLRYNKEMNNIQFSLAKSNNNSSILAIQDDAYWEAMNTLVDLTK